MAIRILSYNIHGGTGTDFRQDYARLGCLLKEESVDIALLQEVDMRSLKRRREDDISGLCSDWYPHFIPGVAVKTQGGWFGNAILSRYPVMESETIDITIPGHEPRNIMEAIIQTPEGVLRVLNTHKGLNHGERRKQLQKLHRLLDRHIALPLFIGGDINEWHTSSKALAELNAAMRPVHVGKTFPSFFPIFHLDRIWCRPACIIESACVLKTRQTKRFSDHLPVLAELSLTDTVG